MDENIKGQLDDLNKSIADVVKASIKLGKDTAFLGIKYFFKKIIFRKSMNTEVTDHLGDVDRFIQQSKSMLIHIHGISEVLGVDDSKYVKILKSYSNEINESLVMLEDLKSKLRGLID